MNTCSLSKGYALLGAAAASLVVDLGWKALGLPGGLLGGALDLLTLALLGAASLFLHRAVKVMRGMSAVCTAAAKGDFEARILGTLEPGLLGEVQRSVNRVLDISDAFVREAAGSMGAVAEGRYYRKVLLRGLPGGYGEGAGRINAAVAVMDERVREFARFAQDNVSAVMDGVATAANAMRHNAEAMSGVASDSNTRATTVAAAAEEASANVQAVAAAAEELASSVMEIGRQILQSSQMARGAVEEADRTNLVMNDLAEAASRIGDVVQLIQTIAGQTNLLALNATIEAARAGEAGKGFAVVASEVKTLAGQTARATAEIAGHVEGIQAATTKAVAALQGIGRTIEEVNQVTSAIAASVEEQGAVTSEIARNATEAAVGTREVSASIAGVTVAAGETGHSAGQVLGAASDLSRQAERLQGEIGAFLAKSRAA